MILFKRVMIYSGFLLLLVSGCATSVSKKDYPIHPVPFTDVRITDNFWAPRMEINRTVTIPHAFLKCEETGRIDNFAIAGGLKEGEHKGIYPFDDTDIYKTLEGASYVLMLKKDPVLENYLDSLITLIGAAQEDDGYLYTTRTNNAERLKNWMGETRWSRIRGSHELYNAGHLFEAAAAHYQATGKRNLLDIALNFADLVAEEFRPGKLQAPPGHQVIEMGLVKLYRITGDEKYLNLAKYLLDVRGKTLDGRELGGEYNQDHKPVIEQDEAVGHAVRASYMFAGMADVAALTGDSDYIRAIRGLWENVVKRKLYITGGIGATGSGEAFAKNYELPNMSAYNETCASIGNVYWNHRLFLLHGESKYIDVLERTLYNALLSGISLDGKHFFYPNPLESVGQHERSEWFGCACCPGNVTRFIASVPGYVYGYTDKEIYVNLYISNEADIKSDARKLKIRQQTGFPWNGNVRILIDPEKENDKFSLLLRIPGWAQNSPVAGDLYSFLDNHDSEIELKVNGEKITVEMRNGYAVIEKKWKSGDEIELMIPMQIKRITANEKVEADRGKTALQRGPFVFCAEWPDNKDGHVRNIMLPDENELETEFRENLFNGVQVITGRATGVIMGDEEGSIFTEEQEFTAIPYYAWAHRGKGEMAVWLGRDESAVSPLGKPTLASVSKVTASYGKNPEAVNDLLEPKSSNDHEVPFFHWWPHKGTKEWVRYDFEKPEEVSTVEVYWFDDTGRGECRPPESWKILYMVNNEWKPVYTTGSYSVAKDRYNKVVFETVKTSSIRLEIQSKPDFAGGIHEWRIK
ncbi:beta-L-arabinofuranosidase domain-containing protein [candidate division KSB1 bacterium]